MKYRNESAASDLAADFQSGVSPDSLLQSTLESMDHGCLVIDDDLTVLAANDRAAEILNISRNMLNAGESFADVIRLAANRGDYGEGDPAEQIGMRLASARSGIPHSFDRIQPDGTVLSARARPMPRGGTVITYTDITEIRSLENRLRSSEERYSLAIAGSKSAIWDWDMDTMLISRSGRFADILGIQKDEVGDTHDWWRNRIHPDDLGSFDHGIESHLSGHSQHFEAEYRVRRRNGDYCWVGDRGAALRCDAGSAYRMAGSVDDISSRKATEAALKKLATTDALTGAYNRRKFMELASREQYRCKRYGGGFSIALFDLDYFKNINDSHGHTVGDACLCAFVSDVQRLIRQSDTLARIGGEEFALLLPETSADAAQVLCERIRERVCNLSIKSGTNQLSFTVSGGIANFHKDDSVETMLSRADELLYRAKSQGRNRLVWEETPVEMKVTAGSAA